jgi:hypothetical protein
MSIDLTAKQQQIKTWATYGFGVVAAAILAPMAFLALEGVLAIVAAVFVLFLVANFAPVVGDYIAVKRIQAIKAVAEANPIETMQDLYAEKVAEFQRQEAAVTEFDTQFRNVSDLVDGLKKTDPDEATQYAAMRDQMKTGLDELRAEQQAAQGELMNAKSTIAKMQRIWNVACAMNKALAASASAQSQVFAQMRQDVAIDTVRTNLNRAFANLNTAVERRRNAQMFSAPAPAAKALPEATNADAIPVPRQTINQTIRR